MKSTHSDSPQFLPKSKHWSLLERQQLERGYKEKVSIIQIAQRLARHRSTIYREIKRGWTKHLHSDLTTRCVYQWDVAQQDYEKNRGGGGRYPKLYLMYPLLEPLTRLITKKRLSAYAAINILKKQGHELDFCEKTLYNHVGKRGFPIGWEHLPQGRYRGRKVKSPTSCRKHKNLKGKSIESHPECIDYREEPGHHEIDLVVGGKGGKRSLTFCPYWAYNTYQSAQSFGKKSGERAFCQAF